MGIKEFFEKHPERDLKLSDIVIEEEGKDSREFFFDPDKEINEKDWNAMIDYTKNLLDRGRGGDFLMMCVFLKHLEISGYDFEDELDFPSYLADLKKYISGEMLYEYLKMDLADLLEDENWDGFLGVVELVTLMRNLFPEMAEMDDIKDKLNDELFASILAGLEVIRGIDWDKYKKLSEAAQILFPNRFSKIVLDDKLFDYLENEVSRRLQTRRSKLDESNIFGLLADLGRLKKIFPNRESSFFKDKKVWDFIRDDMSWSKNNKAWYRYAKSAFTLRMISADRVEVTEKGFKLEFDKTKTDLTQRKLRPERKKF